MDKVKKEELKNELAPPGKWSDDYTKLFHRLIDSFDEPVTVKELSKLMHPQKFGSTAFMAVNSMLKVRGHSYELIIVDDSPRIEWVDLSVKLVEK